MAELEAELAEFRKRVSDKLAWYFGAKVYASRSGFADFILPDEPPVDPLVAIIDKAHPWSAGGTNRSGANQLREAAAKLGKVIKVEDAS
jgi:hypothetical protein